MYVRFSKRGKRYEAAQVRAAAVLLSPLLLTLICLFAMPVALVVFMSATNWSMATGVHDYVGLKNYLYVLGDARFWKSFGNTLTFSLAKICLDTTLALLIAVALDKRIPLRKYLRIAYFAPVVVPIAASSIIWIWFYDPGIGPLNQILVGLGLPPSQWLYGEHTALLSIILFSVWRGLGYNIILFLAGLQGIPYSLIEAAEIDGATSRQILRKIKLPLLAPITAFIIMMDIINCLKVFTEVNVMTPEGGPLNSTLLMVSYIYDQSFTRGKMGRAAAAALVLFCIIFAFTMLQRALGKKSVSYE
jgi:multiple sugar transport system permease protein